MDVDLLQIQYSKWSFYNTFLNRGINTVAQVLDDNLMSGVIKDTRKAKIRDELRGFIDLIKYEFLGEELTITHLLDEPASNLVAIKTGDASINFSRMGFLEEETNQLPFIFYKYSRSRSGDNTDARIIDVFRGELGNKEPKSGFEKKLKIMISSYEHSKDHNVSLGALKRELEALRDKRSKIDVQISSLEEQIAAIEKGAVK